MKYATVIRLGLILVINDDVSCQCRGFAIVPIGLKDRKIGVSFILLLREATS